MKKLTKVLLAILAVVCAAAFFFACDNGGDKNAAETYTVTFYDGAQEVDSKKVEKGGTVETLPEINKAGHEFIGWRIDNDPTQPFDENTAVNFDLKVYAAWNRVYSISYDLQGGSGPTEGKDFSASAGKKIILPAEEGFAKGDLGLYAWSDGSAEYAPGTEYVMPSVDLSLTAVWKTVYTAAFDISGATGETPAALKSTRSVVLPSGDGLEKEGYEFAGWTDGEADYAAGAVYAIKADVTLKALFAGEYTVKLDPDGGELTGETVFVKNSGETVELPLPSRSSEYEFLYWTDGSKTFDANSDYTVRYEDVTLTAVWKVPEYIVKFTDWDGKVFAEQKVSKGQNAEEPETPISSIPEFGGWSQPLDEITGDCTISATYKIPTYNPAALGFTETEEGYVLSLVDSNFGKSITEFYFPATYRGKLVTGTADGLESGLLPVGSAIEKAVFPSTYTVIGDYCCYNLRKLKTVQFGGGERRLGKMAFAYCWELEEFTLPAAVTSIGEQALWALVNVEAFAVENGSASFAAADGVLTDAAGKILYYYPLGSTRTAYEVPASVETIGNYAFNHAGIFFYEGEPYHLASLTFAENSRLKSVGEYAFAYGKFDVTFPASLGSVGKYAFRELYGDVTFSAGTETIGEYAFYRYRGETITLPSTVKNLDAYSFAECTHLVKISFPGGCGVENIGDYAFFESTELRSFDFSKVKTIGQFAFSAGTGHAMYIVGAIHFSENIESIGDYAFSMNAELTGVTFADNNRLAYLGKGAFGECPKLASVDFGKNSALTALPDYCFYLCEKLAAVTLSDNIETIGQLAFGGAEGAAVRYVPLTEITLPASVTGIMSGAFMYCYDLERVIIEGEGLKVIGATAFKHCEALTEIALPASVAQIYPQAFEQCYSLKNLTVSGDHYRVENGGLYETATSKLMFGYVGDDGVFDIAEGTKAIEAYTFYDNQKLKEVSLPASLEVIGEYAFFHAFSLTTVRQAETGSLKSIGKSAFCGDILEGGKTMMISSFRFDEGLASVGEYAFYGNADMTEVSLPASLETIGGYAFYGMTSLERVEFAAGSRLKEISAGCFYNAPALEEVIFGDNSSLEKIGGIAFGKCENIKTLVLTSEKMVAMGNNGFIADGAAVYVPDNLVETYKTNPTWKIFDIRAYSQYAG